LNRTAAVFHELSVVVGRQRLSESGGRTIPVTGIALFSGYIGVRQPIVTLGEDAGVAPVRLATAADTAAPAPGTAAWVTGWVQVGIVETGDGCASPGFYDIFTRVDRISAFARGSGLTQQPYPLTRPRLR
jgi:hypothetical protein